MRVSQYEVRKYIMSLIFSSDFDPNGPLPTFNELTRIVPASMATVNKTIRGLKKEGIVVARARTGIYLNPVCRRDFAGKKICLLSHYDLERLAKRKHTGYPSNVIGAFDAELGKSGLSYEYLSVTDKNEKDLIEKVIDSKPAGIALLEINNPHLVMELKELWLPTVSMDYDAMQIGISSSVFSNILGGFQATRHLIGLGHRKIAAVRLKTHRLIARNHFEDSISEERISGYFIAMKNEGFDPLIPPKFASAADAVGTLLAMEPRPTALFCINNYANAQILAALNEKGIKVPGDMDAITFDTFEVPDRRKWKLPYIKVDSEGMGKAAAELLVSQIKGESTEPRRIVLETELVKP